MENELEIIIVDDHKVFRVGLEAILDSIDNVTVIGDVDNGEDLFKLLRKTEPDIIFMDIDLSHDENGIDLTKKVVAKHNDIFVIAMTSSDEVNFFNDMMDAGANAFLLKNATEEEIKLAIQTVIKGDNYFSREFLYLAKQFNKRQIRKNTSFHLSERETAVLKLICQGLSNQEISEAIGLSIHTVDSHRRNLLAKTGAKNTANLVMTAFKEGLVSIDD